MALTAEQHQIHGPRIQAASVALDALARDLLPHQADAGRALRVITRAGEALAVVRAEMEDLALRDTGECTYETPAGRQDLYYPATQFWLDHQPTCPICGAPKEH